MGTWTELLITDYITWELGMSVGPSTVTSNKTCLPPETSYIGMKFGCETTESPNNSGLYRLILIFLTHRPMKYANFMLLLYYYFAILISLSLRVAAPIPAMVSISHPQIEEKGTLLFLKMLLI